MLDLFGNSLKLETLPAFNRSISRIAAPAGRDLYTTEPRDIARFLDALKRDGLEIADPVWEPAAGHGDISKTLQAYGHRVVSSDIFAYRDADIDIPRADFLTCRTLPAGCRTIFTNPPFNAQNEFLLHALSFGVDVVFFVRLMFLASIKRYRIFRRYKPAYVYVYSKRARCNTGGCAGIGAGMVDYAVIVWKPPHDGETKLRWIP